MMLPIVLCCRLRRAEHQTLQRRGHRRTQVGIAERMTRVAQSQAGGDALKEDAALLHRQIGGGGHDGFDL
jgi:hypothetical protein